MTNVVMPAVKVQRECREVQSVPASPPSLSDINVNMSNRTPRRPFGKSPDKWLVCENDVAQRLSAISSWRINSRYQGSIAIRSLGEMKAAEKRKRVSTDLYLPCLRSDMEWQLWRFDCSVHRFSLDGKSLCADEGSIVSNSVNHEEWKESWGECVRANLYLSFTSVKWQLVLILRVTRLSVAQGGTFLLNP